MSPDYVPASRSAIEKLPVSPAAKKQVEEMLEFCTNLGGEMMIRPPVKEWNHPFVNAYCRLPEPKTFKELRLNGYGIVDFIGEEQWETLSFNTGETLPKVVIWSSEKPKKVRQFYLDNSGGIDTIEGELTFVRIEAAIQENGNYINMEVV